MPFAVRNRLNTMQLVHPYNQRPFVWRPLGDPGGEDVQVLPDDLRTDTSIVKAVKLGNLEFIDDESEIDAAYDKQRTSAQDRASAQAQTIQSHIDTRNTDQEILGLTCVGPGIRSGMVCDQSVLVLAKNAGAQPPLCTAHEALADQYVRTATGQWVRAKQ